MDKLNKELNIKIKKISERYIKINKLQNNNFKKIFLYDNIDSKLNEINELLDNFEIENENNMILDNEIIDRINYNKDFKKLINFISPIIIMYQLNNLNNI